jgi:WD40 repeat protein
VCDFHNIELTNNRLRLAQITVSYSIIFALQMYYSAALWLPHCAPLERVIEPKFDYLLLLTRRQEERRPALQAIEGHSETVDSLAISPDSLRLVSGSADSSVRIWDARTGAPIV